MFLFDSIEFLIVLWLWVGGAVAVGSVAFQTGRMWAGWFIYSILFTPLLAAILMCSVPHKSKKRLYGLDLLEESVKENKK